MSPSRPVLSDSIYTVVTLTRKITLTTDRSDLTTYRPVPLDRCRLTDLARSRDPSSLDLPSDPLVVRGYYRGLWTCTERLEVPRWE